MKKLLLMVIVCMSFVMSSCAIHSKQPIDETYYKRTQSAWPEEEPPAAPKKVAKKKTSNRSGSVSMASSDNINGGLTFTMHVDEALLRAAAEAEDEEYDD